MAKAEKMNRKKEEIVKSVSFMSTKQTMVVKKLETPLIVRGNDGFDYNVDILAKDDVGEYLTHSSYVGVNLLDPFRMYRRFSLTAS